MIVVAPRMLSYVLLMRYFCFRLEKVCQRKETLPKKMTTRHTAVFVRTVVMWSCVISVLWFTTWTACIHLWRPCHMVTGNAPSVLWVLLSATNLILKVPNIYAVWCIWLICICHIYILQQLECVLAYFVLF